MPLIRPDLVETTDASASASTIYTLSPGQTAQGTLSTASDHDRYRITLVAGQTYTFAEIGTGTNALVDTFLYLRDAAGNIVASDDDEPAGHISRRMLKVGSGARTRRISVEDAVLERVARDAVAGDLKAILRRDFSSPPPSACAISARTLQT